MIVYKFNQDTLLFEEDNRLVKYRKLFILFLCCCIVISSVFIVFAIKKAKKERQLSEIIIEKQQIIEQIKEPLREDNYVEDLYKAIGFKLAPQQYKTFSYLSLKYRNQIEDAKVPATLVWWICYKESGFNINAKNSTSSASGISQMINSTWDFCCKLNGEDNSGRFNEEKQVRITLVYLNYLYNKYGNWKQSMNEYHGGVYHYPVNFLLK